MKVVELPITEADAERMEDDFLVDTKPGEMKGGVIMHDTITSLVFI